MTLFYILNLEQQITMSSWGLEEYCFYIKCLIYSGMLWLNLAQEEGYFFISYVCFLIANKIYWNWRVKIRFSTEWQFRFFISSSVIYLVQHCVGMCVCIQVCTLIWVIGSRRNKFNFKASTFFCCKRKLSPRCSAHTGITVIYTRTDLST